ncbi:MAG: prolyl oligopeptidase family protein [Vicinamibacterales bacterium]
MRPTRPAALPLALLLLSTACGPSGPQPPLSEPRPVTDTIQGQSFTDDYRWLENQPDPEVREWITAQNMYADLILGQAPMDPSVAARLSALADTPDIGRAQKGGDFEYFTLRRKGDELAALYRRPATAKGEIDPAEDYELIIDPAPMSDGLSTSIDLVAVTPDGAKLIYGVRDGGQDERELRVRDIAAGRDVEIFPNALYDSVSLKKDGTGFYYVRRSRDTGARVRFHAWGADLASDPVLFGAGYGPTAFVSMSQNDDGSRFLYGVQHGWARNEVWWQDVAAGSPPVPLVRDLDAHFSARWVDHEIWMRTDYQAPMGRVVAVNPTMPAPEHWRTVLAETADALEDYTRIGTRLYGMYIRDGSSRIFIYDETGRPRGEVELPPMVSASVSPDGDDGVKLTVQSFTIPETVYRIDQGTGNRTLEKPAEVEWNADGIVTTLVYGTSKDGTQVPVFVTGRADRPKDGSTRVLLGGYGGFNAAQKPRFSPMAATWIERGGVYAYAVLRGGSEFGEDWHKAGMLTNKQRVFDDFIAAAEVLIANGTTSRERLAIAGTSNGGLLVGAALTQRPDLYGAVLCGFPDVDILRFNQYTTNNNMPALLEYGDAAIPEQFEAIRQFSPYQHVRQGTAYPAVMIWSGDLDTRVPPLAARKFTAALQSANSSSHPIILRYFPKGGHATGNGMPFSGRIKLQAEQLHFLEMQLAR